MKKNNKIVIERNVSSLKLNNKVFSSISSDILNDLNRVIKEIQSRDNVLRFTKPALIRDAIITYIKLWDAGEIELGRTTRTKKVGPIKTINKMCEEEE
jgi:hypothetical protein